MPKVFIPNMVRQDLTAARQWGEFKFINEKYVYPDELTDDGELPVSIRSALAEAALEFNPDLDYVLLVGDDLQRAAFIALVARKCHRLNVLRWDRQAEGYISASIRTI